MEVYCQMVQLEMEKGDDEILMAKTAASLLPSQPATRARVARQPIAPGLDETKQSRDEKVKGPWRWIGD
jgi:hypothetical protein